MGVPSPWNTSRSFVGDLLCDSASQELALAEPREGQLLQNISRGNFGESEGNKLRANRHPAVLLWPPQNIVPSPPPPSPEPAQNRDDEHKMDVGSGLGVVAILSIIGIAILATVGGDSTAVARSTTRREEVELQTSPASWSRRRSP